MRALILRETFLNFIGAINGQKKYALKQIKCNINDFLACIFLVFLQSLIHHNPCRVLV